MSERGKEVLGVCVMLGSLPAAIITFVVVMNSQQGSVAVSQPKPYRLQTVDRDGFTVAVSVKPDRATLRITSNWKVVGVDGAVQFVDYQDCWLVEGAHDLIVYLDAYHAKQLAGLDPPTIKVEDVSSWFDGLKKE